jgi:hypothetical protein
LKTQKANQENLRALLDDMLKALDLFVDLDPNNIIEGKLKEIMEKSKGLMNETTEFINDFTERPLGVRGAQSFLYHYLQYP